MARSRQGTSWLLSLLLGLLALLPACGPRGEQLPDASQDEATAAQWDWLQQTHKRLGEQRRRLARLEARSAGKPPSEELARLRKEVDDLGEDFNRRLVEYINANAGSGDSGAAIRLKSEEDILLAHEYIEEAGDYRRAIEIYETALAADPENARLKTELEAARARRYVTRERFAQVREGMAQEDVRRLLGPPNLQDVRDYPERGVTAWFYPKNASGAAAAVWFRKGTPPDADPQAYLLDFDAIQPPSANPPARRPAPARPQPTPAATPAPTETP